MRRRQELLTLADHLLNNAVFHNDSIIIYTDNSWSLGRVDGQKYIKQVFSPEVFDGSGATTAELVLRDGGLSAHKALIEINAMKKSLTERRGHELAFHHDRSERHMLRAAAESAARQPEAAVLYQDYNAKESYPQRLRFFICPDENIYLGSQKAAPHYTGQYIPASGSIVVSAPKDADYQDRITVHELVHAYDQKKKIYTKLPDNAFKHTLNRLSWLRETAMTWQYEPNKLDRQQQQFIHKWEQASRHFAESGNYPYLQPEDPECGIKLLLEVINGPINDLTQLSEEMYPTPLSRLKELMPLYEEAVAKLGTSRLDFNDPGRVLMRLALPMLGKFIDKEYLAPLNKSYAKIMESGLFLSDAQGQLVISNAPLLPLYLEPEGRLRKDTRLRITEEERALLEGLRSDLQQVLQRQSERGITEHMQHEEDRIFCAFRDLFMNKCGSATQAEMLALEEIYAAKEAVNSIAEFCTSRLVAAAKPTNTR